MRTPILLNSCAHAASAQEARFRAGTGRSRPRRTGVVALDTHAAVCLESLRADPPCPALFLRAPETGPDPGPGPACRLSSWDGTPADIDDTVAGLDLVLMVATDASGAPVAAMLSMVCALRGIATAALVLHDGRTGEPVTSALRPHARVLLLSDDADDAAALLAAVGG